MTIDHLIEKYKAIDDQLEDKINIEKDLFKIGTVDFYRSVIQDFIDDLQQLDDVKQDFICDYLIKVDEDNIPRCKVHAYCNPKGCKDREVNGKSSEPNIKQVTEADRLLFWQDGVEVAE